MVSPGRITLTAVASDFGKDGRGHRKPISQAIWYPHDTGMFITSSLDKYVKVWDTNAEEVVRDFFIGKKVFCISLSEISVNHSLIATGSEDSHVTLCDIRNGTCISKLLGHQKHVLTVKWRPGHEYELVSGSGDGTIRYWDIRKPGPCMFLFDHFNTKKNINRSPKGPNQNRFQAQNNNSKAHEGSVMNISFLPESSKFLSTGSDQRIRCWDCFDGSNQMINFPGVRNSVKPFARPSMSISGNGKLVFHPIGNKIDVFEISTGNLVHSLQHHFQKVNCCIFNPFLQELYSGGNDAQINVWTPQIHFDSEESSSSEDWIDSIEEIS